MIATEFITEVFTSNVSSEVVRATSDLYTTKATIGGRVIVFNASQYDDDEGKSVWEIDFTEYEKDGTGTTFRKTGSGNELQVFSFVIESIKDLISSYHPDQLTFTSHKADDNRTKLYQRMLNRIKVPGYHAAPVDSGEYDDYFKIVKDNLSEDDGPVKLTLNNNDAAKQFIEKVYTKYPYTMQNNHVMVWGEGDEQQFAMFELIPSFSKRGAVEVKWFQAYPLRQGVGSKAMKELQAMAREDDIALTLFPWDKGQVSQSKLTKFYKGQGFKPTVKGAKNMQWDPSIDEAEVATKNSNEIWRQLKDAGYQYVGSGADATVFAKDDSHVIKILMPEVAGSKAEQVFRKFYEFSMSHQDLPCIPRFNEVNTIDINGKDYTQIEMERLSPLEKNSFVEGLIWYLSDFVSTNTPWETVESELADADTWYMYNPNYSGTFARTWQSLLENPASKKTYAMYRQLYNVMKLLYITGTINKFGWDLHTANVMQRKNGQPVIIDPWFSEGTS